MSREGDSNVSGMTEFGPITPDDRPQSYGFSISRFFRRGKRGKLDFNLQGNQLL